RCRNSGVVTAAGKEAADRWIGYVGKGSAIDVGGGDFQDPAIKRALKAVEVVESYHDPDKMRALKKWVTNRYFACIKALVTHRRWVIDKGIVRRRVRHGCGGDPKGRWTRGIGSRPSCR